MTNMPEPKDVDPDRHEPLEKLDWRIRQVVNDGVAVCYLKWLEFLSFLLSWWKVRATSSRLDQFGRQLRNGAPLWPHHYGRSNNCKQ